MLYKNNTLAFSLKWKRGMRSEIKYWCAWVNIIVQVLFPAAISFTPSLHAYAKSAPYTNHSIKTRTYSLKKGENIHTVVRKFGVSANELRDINQFRVFRNGLNNIAPGDELDIPVRSEKTSSTSILPSRSTNSNLLEVASTISQAGNILGNVPKGGDKKSIVANLAATRVSKSAQNWLHKFGTARVQLSVDKNLSPLNFSFGLLHPWYDTSSDIIFSQSTLNRTDERTQANMGIGWRHFFNKSAMTGSNIFFDHDISRNHSRIGVGVEYWRDYLKLSSNAYLRLSGWRNSPDTEYYNERPANGWDLRAEAYLPAYPQLGVKLIYEQYYGNEVGLLGNDNRQRNPQAITTGISYTPFPLMTFSANHKQGKNGKSDNSFTLDFHYVIGEPLRKQLDTFAVSERRSLFGSRYDFIDRNNNIVLEYHKKELIKINLPSHIEGFSKQTLPLKIFITKAIFGLKEIKWNAESLFSAGGKITEINNQWFITLPTFRSDGNNQYPLAAVAYDSKGNASEQVQTTIQVRNDDILN
ncbi:TPA: inverse autotransporter beta domain-containing protein, partial [Salmonella enterica subsp. enterica serovar Eastbourne]|nr:hypothetical protein [Salmonella enterica subsp. enterica serovar Eastbourne]HDN7459911.1 inverse autotransporter beta domain-containing protein [Salmonella enterica subsp. enterica serovar Eastbourne]HDN7576957.1 inverse autotransporter beta domain-containing protein [Salmonella enterica subsp. enterica serovar Eastbourne]